MKSSYACLTLALTLTAAGCSSDEVRDPQATTPPPPTEQAKTDAIAKSQSDEEKDPVARANRLFTQGNIDGAIAEITKALKANPDDARARYFYANYLIDKGELRGAEVELERALGLQSRDVPAAIAWTRLGEVRERQGEHREALAAYLKSLEAERDAEARIAREKPGALPPPEYRNVPHGSPEPYRNVARICIYLGDLDQALSALEQARSRSPRDPFTESLAVHAYQRMGDEASAIECARRFLDYVKDEPAFAERAKELRELVRSNAPPLSTSERRTLIDYVRTAIRPHLPGDIPEEHFFSENPVERLLRSDDRAVFVTVIPTDPSAARLRGRGRGRSLAAAIAGAVSTIKDAPKFSPVATRQSAVRIDIEKGGLEPVSLSPAEYAPADEPVTMSLKAKPDVEPGIHGIASRVDDRELFCLPGDAVTEDLPDVKAMLEFAAREAGLPARAWENASSRVYRFRTESFVSPEPGAAPVDLVRGEPVPFPEATAEACLDGATLGAWWLASDLMLEERPRRPDEASIAGVTTVTFGKFHYEYRARTDTFEDGAYSDVRHAGAAISLVEANVRTGRAEFRDTAELAARWLEDHAQTDQGRVVIVVDQRAALGTQALTLVLEDALAESASQKPDPAQDPAREARLAFRDGLARTILGAIRDDGTFPNWIPVRGLSAPRDRENQFFPGEAILALVRHFKATGERRWLDAATRTADARIKDWRARVQQGLPPLDAWFAQAIAEMDELEPLDNDPAQAARRAFGLEIAQSILEHQAGPDRGDAAGGLSPPGELFPRGMATASLGEGLAAIAHMAKRRGLPQALALRDAVRRAASFALRHQYTGRQAFYLPNPDRARGAFRTVLTGSMVRIDGVQHNVELLLLTERLLRE
jgi:tetratricopeptide (TPR) repeat protein